MTAYLSSAVCYVVIERQWSDDLAIRYPDRDTAEHALERSLFIDGLCEEDCLDAYVTDTMPWIDGYDMTEYEHVTPPDNDHFINDTPPWAKEDQP